MHNIARSAASAALALSLATGTLLVSTTLVAPAFAQAAQRAGVVVALLTFALVIRLRPRALFAAITNVVDRLT